MRNWEGKETISRSQISTRITFIILQVIILLLSAYPSILVWRYYAIKDVRRIKIDTRITFIILRICMTKHKISIDTTLDKFYFRYFESFRRSVNLKKGFAVKLHLP